MNNIELIISKKPKKCRYCKNPSYKEQILPKYAPENLGIEFYELRCIQCGKRYVGKLRSNDVQKIKLSRLEKQKIEEKYALWEEQRKIKRRGYKLAISKDTGRRYKTHLTCQKCNYGLDNWIIYGDSATARYEQNNITVECPKCHRIQKNCIITLEQVVIF
jgi:hypothetical protein